MIPALVLTAGRATRLSPLSRVRAKAALPVGGQPLAARILRYLAAAGVTDAILNLHHLPASITSRVGDGSGLGVRVRYSWEPQVLGSAGGPRQAFDLVDAATQLVINGDTLTDLDLHAIIDAHRQSQALVTIAVIPNPRPEHYSGITADEHGGFTGTVPRGSSQSSFHVIGVYVVETRAFASLEPGVAVPSVWPLYTRLQSERPGAVRIFNCAAQFLDIGTPDDYFVTCRSFNHTAAPLIESGNRLELHPTAEIQESILWDDVSVGSGARLNRCIVTDGVRIPAGTVWDNVIIRTADGSVAAEERVVGDLATMPLSAPQP